jgi:hypothetical protein
MAVSIAVIAAEAVVNAAAVVFEDNECPAPELAAAILENTVPLAWTLPKFTEIV